MYKGIAGGCEIVIVDVHYQGNTYIRHVLVYRPPDTSLDDSKEPYKTIFDKLQNVRMYMLYGDFNLPDISWSELTTRSQVSQEFLTMCFKLGAEQIVNFPTRGSNVLDLVLCSERSLVNSITSETPFSNSDHVSILCHLCPYQKLSRNYLAKPCFDKADFQLINAFLTTLEWDVIYANCVSAVDYWLAFKDIMNTVTYNFVPFSTPKNSRHSPWFNTKLKRLRVIKQRKWHRYIRNKNIVTHTEYKCSANKFRTEFINAKCEYEKKLFSTRNNSGSFYGYVKSQTKRKCSIPSLKKQDGSLATSDLDKAIEFSNYFSTVFTEDNNVTPIFNYDSNSRLEQFTCDVRTMIKVVLKLKSNSSPGPDGFTAGFVKKILAHVATPLCQIYKQSLTDGIVPDEWKSAHIIPIFKKGDQQKTSQYRPVSLTSIFSKILERIIRPQLLDFMYLNNLVPKDQHGFVPKRSTVTNLLECMNLWTLNFDKKLSTDVIYLDYSKCFDSVCHSKFLYKISKYGISGAAFKWIQSFLLDRYQYVKINNTLSPSVRVISGVPQGTVLGPIFYLLFTADLPNVVSHSNISMYADDTKIFRPIQNNSDCVLLQKDLNSIFLWAKKWQMKLNPEKTKHLRIGSDMTTYVYTLENKEIENVKFINDVGVTIQSDLKFSIHCTNIARKAFYTIRTIFDVFKKHDLDFYVRLYNCYVRPILEHTSQVWFPNLCYNVDKVERVQRFFTRRILYGMSYEDRLLRCNLEKLELRRIRSDQILFFKMVRKETDLNLYDYFKYQNRLRGHNLNLYVPYCRTDKRQKFFIVRIISLWNKLSANIVNCNNSRTFKKLLQTVDITTLNNTGGAHMS